MSATIKGDIRNRIAGLSAITSASATVDIDRNRHNTQAPRIVLKRSEFRTMETLLPSETDNSLLFESFECVSYGTSSLQAETLSDAICDDLETLSGNLGASRKVAGVTIDGKDDNYLPDDILSDAGEAAVLLTFTVQHVPQ